MCFLQWTYVQCLAGLSIVCDRELIENHVMTDSCELIGIKVQQKAVEGALEAKPLHTVTTVIHEEHGS